MKLKNPSSFIRKFLKPCIKLMALFNFRKPVCIRPLKSRCRKPRSLNPPYKGRLAKILSALHSIRRTNRDMDRLTELKSFSDTYHQKAPYSSPITPAYIRVSAAILRKEVSDQDEVEDACRSFENYLIQMIVEQGKMTDLVDIEDLLYSWKNLKSPVFIDLVCRFYGELCRDLFSNSSEIDNESQKYY